MLNKKVIHAFSNTFCHAEFPFLEQIRAADPVVFYTRLNFVNRHFPDFEFEKRSGLQPNKSPYVSGYMSFNVLIVKKKV